MQPLLDGKSLIWISLDEVGVFTAATNKMLHDHYEHQAIKVQLLIAATPDDVMQLAQRHVVGLITLVLQQPLDAPAACRVLMRMRGRLAQPVCVCFLAPDRIETIPALLESGAQVIVSQLSVWQRALPRTLARAPRSKQGFHPLTAGLVDRLPWKDEL